MEAGGRDGLLETRLEAMEERDKERDLSLFRGRSSDKEGEVTGRRLEAEELVGRPRVAGHGDGETERLTDRVRLRVRGRYVSDVRLCIGSHVMETTGRDRGESERLIDRERLRGR